jgi:hypothetical protein
MNIDIIHCDACDSTNVLQEPKRTARNERHFTMTQFIEKHKQPQMQLDVYLYTYYILLCKDCGHRLEYHV